MAEPTRITKPDGTVLELVETIASAPETGRRRTRAKARKQALDLLFQADLREADALELLAELQAQDTATVRDFTVELVQGVVTNQAEIDAQLADQLAAGWTLERMPRVDRNLARLAVFELQHTATPADVVVAEALALCQELSTDESPAFVNGLLSAVIAHRDRAAGT